jgi:hypothetical protein
VSKMIFEKAWEIAKMPVGDRMFRASRPTRKFDWEAHGDTEDHARDTLANMWRNWMASNPDVTMSLEEFMDDVGIDEIVSGQARMDREPYGSQTYGEDYLHEGPNDPTPDVMRQRLLERDMEELKQTLGDPTKDNDYRYLSEQGLREVGDDEIRDIYEQSM